MKSRFNGGLRSSETDEWETPQWLFDLLDKKYHFFLDAAASIENAKCSHFYDVDIDGLTKPWIFPAFCNPPYGRKIGAWVQKAFEESRHGTVVMLLPARTDTAWFHDYCVHGRIAFIRGRLRFGGSMANAPFPSMVVEFGRHKEAFVAETLEVVP